MTLCAVGWCYVEIADAKLPKRDFLIKRNDEYKTRNGHHCGLWSVLMMITMIATANIDHPNRIS